MNSGVKTDVVTKIFELNKNEIGKMSVYPNRKPND